MAFNFLAPGWQTCKRQTNPGTATASRIRPDPPNWETTMSEQTVYGAADSSGGQERSDRGLDNPRATSQSSAPRTKVRTHHLQKWKAEGHKWAMLTAYDY